MVSKAHALTLYALLNKYYPKEISACVRLLDPKLASEFTGTPPQDLPRSILNVSDLINSIHYSHFFPLLQKYPKEIQELIISSLPKNIQEGLLVLFAEKISLKEVPEVTKDFFLHYFLQTSIEGIFPKEFLPPSSFNSLLSISKSDLVKIIDLLGCEDLAVELRKVMDRKILDELKKNLTAHQNQYLDLMIKKTDLPIIKNEGIQFWLQNIGKLNFIIHKKGLLRFAIAIKDEDKDFLWHLFHILDTGRAGEIEKLLQSSDVLNATQKTQELLRIQVLNLLKAFHRG